VGDPAVDVADAPGDDAPGGLPRWRPDSALTLRDGASWWLLLGYVAAAIAVMARVLWHPSTQTPGPYADPSWFAWWFAWALHWLTHGGNLLHPDVLNAPVGISALWNTSALGLALPAAPITALFGPVASYNVMVVAGMACTAWVGSLAAARWVSRPAAAVAGLLAGFGAAELGQAEAHVHLVWMLYPELLVLLGTDLARGAPPRRIGLWVAAATCWQFFISVEVLITSAMFAGVLAVGALLAQPSVRRRVRALLVAAGTAAVATGAVLAYPVADALGTPSRNDLVSRPPVQFSAHLLNLVLPTPVQLVAPWRDTAAYGGRLSEGGLYLGVPLLVVLGITCWITRHRAATRVFAGTALVMGLLSLGPQLHVAGGALPVYLPWTVLRRILPLAEVLPVRVDAYVYLCAAMLAGFAVDLARKARWTRPRAAGAIVVAAACLVAWLPRPIAPTSVRQPAFFQTDDVDVVPAGSLVRTIPWETTRGGHFGAPLLWQAEAGMRYRITGIFPWNGVPAPIDDFDALTAPGALRRFSAAQGRSACTALRVSGTGAVLVLAGQPYSDAAAGDVRRITHVAGRAEGGMIVYLLAGSPCGGS
jgi:hypothetical protein